MPIEFPCPSCNRMLRVPDDTAGQPAQCPNCQGISIIPGGSGVALPEETRPEWSFREPLSGDSPPSEKRLGSQGVLNPYAPSAPIATLPKPLASPISNQTVSLEEIMGHAWEVWKGNLGLLVGVTFVAMAIFLVIDVPRDRIQKELFRAGDHEAAIFVTIGGTLLSTAVNVFLGIGQATIALKLARGQPAEFMELFSGGSRFFSTYGAALLATIGVYAGLIACILPGIYLAMTFWPYFYVLVEERGKVMESFSVAAMITEGNRATGFVLALISVAVILLGGLALCVGILFAAPLVTMMWATAYLMMSGQLQSQSAKLSPAY